MHRLKRTRKKNFVVVLVIALALIAGILAVSINWQGLISRGGGGDGGGSEVVNPPHYALGTEHGGAPGIGEVAAEYTPTGTALNNSNINASFRDLGSGSGGNFYLTEDIVNYVGFSKNNHIFSGTLDGNGHSITITSKGDGADGNTVGGVASILGNSDSAGYIKNLTIIYSTSIWIDRVSPDKNLQGMGLVVGNLRKGAVENTRVVVNSGVTITYVSNSSEAAVGGIIGVAGNRSGSSEADYTQTVTRCAVEINGTVTHNSNQWHWMGGVIGNTAYSTAWVNQSNIVINNFIFTGSGTFQMTGSNNLRVAAITGGYRNSGKLKATGVVIDLYGGAGKGMVGETSATIIQDNSGEAVNVTASYAYTARSATYSAGPGSNTLMSGRIDTAIDGQSIVAMPNFTPDGNFSLSASGFSDNFLDFETVLGGTSKHKLNGNNKYNRVNLTVCAFSELTANAKLKILAPVAVNSADPSKFIQAIKDGRTVRLEGSIAITNAFEANVVYGGTILGNNNTVRITGAGSAYTNVYQGGIAAQMSGGSVRDLKIVLETDVLKTASAINTWSQGALGLITGRANQLDVINTHVTIKTGKTMSYATSGQGNVNVEIGGMMGIADGKVNIRSSSVTVESGAKITAGSDSNTVWGWTGGFIGATGNTAPDITFSEVLFTGSGTLEQYATSGKIVGGLIGSVRTDLYSGAKISVTDYIFGFDGVMSGTPATLCRVFSIYSGAMPTAYSVNGYHYTDADPSYKDCVRADTQAEQTIGNKYVLRSKVISNTGAETALSVKVAYDFAARQIALTTGKIEPDIGFVWTLELRGGASASAKVLATLPIYGSTESYSLSAPLEAHSYGLYMKSKRLAPLPDDLKIYEHGYVPNNYAVMQGYFDNPEWTQVSNTQNNSAIGALSGDKKYFLTENITVAGFGVSGAAAFSGILDGCGYTITIDNDGGGTGTNGSLGGLAAELTGTIKNARIVVKTSVARIAPTNIINFGLLAGQMNPASVVQNVKVTLDAGCTVTLNAPDVNFSVGGIAGAAAGTEASPVTMTNVTANLNGVISVVGGWNWVGGIVGRNGAGSGISVLNAKQVIFCGEGALNNPNTRSDRTPRTAGLVGGNSSQGTPKVNCDGFIYAFEGEIFGNECAIAVVQDAGGRGVVTINNVYKMSNATTKSQARKDGALADMVWVFGTGTKTGPNNITTVASSFNAPPAASVGYTLALFDPSVAVGAPTSLVLAANFEDGKEIEFLVARVEITYGDQSQTLASSISKVNVFTLPPNANYVNIDLHIKATSVTDGTVSLDGNRSYIAAAANNYGSGWLSDNGRVPAGYGVPTGASEISSVNDLTNWIEGKDSAGAVLDATATGYLYAYLTGDLVYGASPNDIRTLAAGRTLDGLGKTISLAHAGNSSVVLSSSAGRLDWLKSSTSYLADVFGDLFAVNSGTIRNLTLSVLQNHTYAQSGTANRALVFGLFAGINKGLIENCAVEVTGTTGLKGNPLANSTLVFGGIAGVNQGTIRYATVNNRGTIAMNGGKSRQKILGGIAGINDGGVMEYLVSSGAGYYRVSGVSFGSGDKKGIIMGGILGYGTTNSGAGPTISNGVNGDTWNGIRPAPGTLRYAIHQFTGAFNLEEAPGGYVLYGAVSGYISHDTTAPAEQYKSKGIYSLLRTGANSPDFIWRKNEDRPGAGNLQITSFFGGDDAGVGNTQSNQFSGGYIRTNLDGTTDALPGDQTYHAYWDFWGGSGDLRYEIADVAALAGWNDANTMFTYDANTRTGSKPNSAMGSTAGAPSVVTMGITLAQTYGDLLRSFSTRGAGGDSWGTEATSGNFYSGGHSILQGSGNFYLGGNISVNLANKNNDNDSKTYSGTFDGRGHTITISGSLDTWGDDKKDCYGLLADKLNGTIKNLKIVYNGSMKRETARCNDNWNFNTGIVCGLMQDGANIENVDITMGSNARLEGNLMIYAKPMWGGVYGETMAGVLAGRMEGGTAQKISINYGSSFSIETKGNWGLHNTGDPRKGRVGVSAGGLVGWQTGGSIANIYIKGNINFNYYYTSEKEGCMGLLLGRQTGGTIDTVVLDNTQGQITRAWATQETGDEGKIIGKTGGTVRNIALVGSVVVRCGSASAAPTLGVRGDLRLAYGSFQAAISASDNFNANFAASVTDGTNGAGTPNSAGLYVKTALLAKTRGWIDDLFQARQVVVARNAEMGYFFWELANNAKSHCAPGDGKTMTDFGESYFNIAAGTVNTEKSATRVDVGMRAVINIVKTGKTGGNSADTVAPSGNISEVYTGTKVSPYAFRPVYYGKGGAGNASVLPLAWDVGGKINSGRVPELDGIAAPTFSLPKVAGNEGYFYYNTAAHCYIKVENAQDAATIQYSITKSPIAITSDTSEPKTWKDRGTITVKLQAGAVDGAIDQIIYSVDGGTVWKAVNASYNNGVSQIFITTESLKGGSEILLRGYSGINIVTQEMTAGVRIAVDTALPTILWNVDNAPFNQNNATRTMIVKDVSVCDTSVPLAITGPDGHGLGSRYNRTPTRENDTITVTDNGAKVSGDYTFTVTDMLGRQSSITEYLDFTPASITATVPTVTKNGITVLNKPQIAVALTLRDNHTAVANLINTLTCKIYSADGNTLLQEFNTQNGGIDASAFHKDTGTGSVTLNLPDINFTQNVNVVFEVTDESKNLTSVTSLGNVYVDTREYTINIKKPITDETPYSGALTYLVNGTSKLATGGAGDVLHIFKVSLFDDITVNYTKKAGYTYGGLVVYGGEGGAVKVGEVPVGIVYTVGLLGADEHRSGGAVRNISFVATQEIKLKIDANAVGSGKLPNGSWSDTVADYITTDGEGQTVDVTPNFLSPNAAAYIYDAAEGDYTLPSTVITRDNISTYFDIELWGTNADDTAYKVESAGGVLTFPKDETGEKFMEGVYTLKLIFKAGQLDDKGNPLSAKYTILDGSVVTATVTEKGRRNIIINYSGAKQVEYNGVRPIFGAESDGLNFTSQLAVVFDEASFTEDNPRTEQDDRNLEGLAAGLDRLSYTLYQNGIQTAKKAAGTTTGEFALSDVGNYFIDISIPVSGKNKFTGVSGGTSVGIAVGKKTVVVRAENQSVIYGNGIDTDKYYFDGLVAKDVTGGGTTSRADSTQVQTGVMTSMPKLFTEYTSVKIVGGVVSAYENAITIDAGIAKNYAFTAVAANLTITKRNIIMKIEDRSKEYDKSDPSLLNWAVSNTQTGTAANMGYAYSDNYQIFKGSEFARELGEDAYRWTGSAWALNSYVISGKIEHGNYNVTVENGVFLITRTALAFAVSGDQGLIYEQGITHTVTAKITNGKTTDKLTVAVEKEAGSDWENIGSPRYRLQVRQAGAASESGDGYFANYFYSTEWVAVRIGASILNIVIEPQVIIYGSALNNAPSAYKIEGLKAGDEGCVIVNLFLEKADSLVGKHAGVINATVSFLDVEGRRVEYTPIIRKGNLTVLPKMIDISWGGTTVVEYNGAPQEKSITAAIKEQQNDNIALKLSHASSVIAAGKYTFTAAIEGDNADCYVINPGDRTRDLTVQPSEQRISLKNSNSVFEARTSLNKGTKNIYMAEIPISSLLNIFIKGTGNGYVSSANRIPRIEVYSISNITASGTELALHALEVGGIRNGAFVPDAGTNVYVEPGVYNAVATLDGSDNFYKNSFSFVFTVKNMFSEIIGMGSSPNQLTTKGINGSFAANDFNQIVSINDASKLGYIIGPNNKGTTGISVDNSGIFRLSGDNAASWGGAFNNKLSDGYYGTHDGDWAFTFFNVSVTEEMRQSILQGKVTINLSYHQETYTYGQRKGALGVPWNGTWREDVVDGCDLSYTVREVSSASDTQFDAANGDWTGYNDKSFDINSQMSGYGSKQGMKNLTSGLQLTQEGEDIERGWWWNDRRTHGTDQSRDVAISQGAVKSGAAFRFYLVSQTRKSTRTDQLCTGNSAADKPYIGNKRNGFAFNNIRVTFKENSPDSTKPIVRAGMVKDRITGGQKYQFTITDENGIDLKSVATSIGGVSVKAGDGLSLVQKTNKTSNTSPIITSATFESGIIGKDSRIGEFTVSDLAGNQFKGALSVDRDITSPLIGDIQVSSDSVFSPSAPPANETFWYNKRQYLSALVTEAGAVNYGVYHFKNGVKQVVPSNMTAKRIVTSEALSSGLYYLWAEDESGNLTTMTFNLLVDETSQEGLNIVIDEKIVKPGEVYEGSWQKGDVVIENTVSKFGESFGRMYYATSDTDFKNSYQTDPNLQWFAMDVTLVDGKLVLSETIKTAQMKYYAFKYVSGSASYPGATDYATAYAYLGFIKIDREAPSIAVDSFQSTDGEIGNAISSGLWTNKDITFVIAGTTGLSKGCVEYSPLGVNTPDADWYRPSTAGYGVEYFNYTTNEYTQELTDACFKPNSARTSFEYLARLVIRGQNVGNYYAFRFVNGANAVALATIGEENLGFKVNIDTLAPEITSINSSWQASATSSQIYIREVDSGVVSVLVYAQKTGVDGNGIFENGAPVFETSGQSATMQNNRWYFTFSGLWYHIVATDTAGNVGNKDVKLKIDVKAPEVSLQDGAVTYGAKWQETSADAPVGNGVWAYTAPDGKAYLEFRFTVRGGVSGYTFAYSKVGYTALEKEWMKPGDSFNQSELEGEQGSYEKQIVFRVEGDVVEQYTFRFTSGAQKSVYFNFRTGKAVEYSPEMLNDVIYYVNIDGIAPTIDGAEYVYDGQWRPLAQYDDSAWVTAGAVQVRFLSSEQKGGSKTGFQKVEVFEGDSDSSLLVTEENGYFNFFMSRNLKYLIRAYDNAGNIREFEIAPKKIDLVAPTIQITPTVEGGGTYVSGAPTNKTVTLKYTLNYGDSQINSILLKANGVDTVYTEEELAAGISFANDCNGKVILIFVNKAGVTATSEIDLLIDKTMPTVSVTGLPSEYTTEQQEITVQASDANGSGLKTATMVSSEPGDMEIDLMAQTVAGKYTFTVSDWREYTVRVEDNAGNIYEYSFAANVDATIPENFEMSATVDGGSYTPGVWSTKDILLTFTVNFAKIGGIVKYGKIEYRVDGGEWQTLFLCSAEMMSSGKYTYRMTGETNGNYEFRASTLAGKPSLDTVNFGKIMLDTVTPELTAVGKIGDKTFNPDATVAPYNWVVGDIDVTFGYTIGISGGHLYYEYSVDGTEGSWKKNYFTDGDERILLKKGDAAGKMTYKITTDGYYKFYMNNLANESAPVSVNYKEVKRDDFQPKMETSTLCILPGGGTEAYTQATWTSNSVRLIITLTLGKSYLDSKLYYTTGTTGDYSLCANYDPSRAKQIADGRYSYTYTMDLTENQMNNYDFKAVSGAGAAMTAEITRSGGAIRIDKSQPKIESISVISQNTDYATWNGNEWVAKGWTKEDIKFTVKIKTYLSGGTLKYTYGGLAGYTSENISAVGAPTTGTDENGTFTLRSYSLTLSGANMAMDSQLKFRVESGAGKFSNEEDDAATTIPVKIDKKQAIVDENTIRKTPNVEVNKFTSEEMVITFAVYDPQVNGIASGVKSVEFGIYANGVWEGGNHQTLTPGADNRYEIRLSDNRAYSVRVEDNAGNIWFRTFEENIDRARPEIRVTTAHTGETLATGAVQFTFADSIVGVSGATVQYSLDNGASWKNAGDIKKAFVFDTLQFNGTLYFRAISGAGLVSEYVTKTVKQDLKDYHITTEQKVVASGSYANSISYTKNAATTTDAPLMKNGELLTVRISEKAQFPLLSVKVNDENTLFETVNGAKQFTYTIGDKDVKIEIFYQEIVSVSFNQAMLSQTIRVVDGINQKVAAPYSITGDRQGFGYTVSYIQEKDKYGKDVSNGKVFTSVPQELGVYRMQFTVTDNADIYRFDDASNEQRLTVYYFELVKDTMNGVEYYPIMSAFDLPYIRYYMASAKEFRQTKNITVTTAVVAKNGGDWTIGAVGILGGASYNGANYTITFANMEMEGKSLFGVIGAGATVKNVGIIYKDTVVSVASGASFAPFADKVAGNLQNVYVNGNLKVRGNNAKVAGIAVEITATGAMTAVFGGAKIDIASVTGDGVAAAGLAITNAGKVSGSYSAGTIIGGKNFISGSMLVLNMGETKYDGCITVASALYSVSNILVNPIAEGVTVVKYQDLVSSNGGHTEIPILSESAQPKTNIVTVGELIRTALNGLEFKRDSKGLYYVPIASYQQLLSVNNYLWADFRQEADIDCLGKEVAIAQNAPFSGSYNGQGYIIKNVAVSDALKVINGYGMFGIVTGLIENVNVKELSITARGILSEDVIIGGLVRELIGGTVQNVSVGGTIIAGVANGNLTVGGIVGTAKDAKIKDVLSTISITTEKSTKLLEAGSVVGSMTASRVERIYSIAKVDAYFSKRASVGQLIGSIKSVAADDSYANFGYSVEGITYVNGFGRDAIIGSDVSKVAGADFKFIPFSEIMNKAQHPTFIINAKHISETLKSLFPFQKGTGVVTDPFEITTAEEFKLIGNYLYASYNVTKDIDFEGDFETIGKGMKFTGSIRGTNGGAEAVRELSGLNCTLVDQNYGTIESLSLQVNYQQSVAGNVVFGAVANYNYGRISFAKAHGIIYVNIEGSNSAIVGGIVGVNYNPGYVGNSVTEFTAIIGGAEVDYGGTIGCSYGGSSYKNIVQGRADIIAMRASVGMLIGYLGDAGTEKATVITRETNSGNVNADIFLTITLNMKKIGIDDLYNKTL